MAAFVMRTVKASCSLTTIPLNNYLLTISSISLSARFTVVKRKLIRLFNMRPLTEEETKELFEKLSKYIGENVKLLIDRPDGNYCFRLAKDRIFYVREGVVGELYIFAVDLTHV